MNRIGSALLAICLILPATDSAAQLLQVSFFDAAGDQESDPPPNDSQIDLLSMRLVFDNANGSYQVTFTTSNEHPLFGPVQLNANMLNGDLPYIADPQSGGPLPPAVFKDNLNDLIFDTPQTSFALVGQNEHLTHWNIGDHIGTDSDAFPDAFPNGLGSPGGSFLTTLQGRPGLFSDLYDTFPYRTTMAVVTAVPLPLPGPLLLLGIIAVGRRRVVKQLTLPIAN